MKTSEKAIEKVLAGLRNADAPVGIERRILESLQHHASTRSRSGWRRWAPVWLVLPPRPATTWSSAGGLAFAGIFALALAILPTIHRPGTSSAPSRKITDGESLSVMDSGVVVSGAQPPSRPSSLGVPGTPFKQSMHARKAEPLRDRLVAPREMRVVSFPAPPMPLTEQEKLLLRIAHRSEPEEIAMLNPEIRAEQEAEARAEFHDFFEPPAKLDNN